MAYPNVCVRTEITTSNIRLGMYGSKGLYWYAIGK